MTRSEAARLRELAEGKVVLEIGAWLGFSTVLMAQVAQHVVSVDWHREDADHAGGIKDRPVTLGPYIDNLCDYGVLDKVTPIVGDSIWALGLLAYDYFDMAFVDGGHSYEMAFNDGLLAAAKVCEGGIVCFHDYDSEGVKRAVDTLYVEGEIELGPGSLATVWL